MSWPVCHLCTHFSKIFFSETAVPVSEILCGASMGRGNKSLIVKSRSHDQDGHHTHNYMVKKKKKKKKNVQ